MSEVKLVKVPNVIREVVHVCRSKVENVKNADVYVFSLIPGKERRCNDCGGTYYRMEK